MLGLKSSQVKTRLKESGVDSIEVSDNTGFTHYFQIYPYCGYLLKEDGVVTTDVSDNSGVTSIKVSDNTEFGSINIFEIRWGYY